MAAGEVGKSEYAGYKFDEDRIAKLFKELDANKDGKIDINELSEGLKRLGVKHIPGSAEVCKLEFALGPFFQLCFSDLPAFPRRFCKYKSQTRKFCSCLL